MAKRKKSPTLSKIHDTKFIGSEPNFVDKIFMTESDRRIAKIDAFNWYAYMYNPQKDYTKTILEYVKDLKWSSSLIPYIRSLNIAFYSHAFPKLLRMERQGWILSKHELELIESTTNLVKSDAEAAKKSSDEAKKLSDKKKDIPTAIRDSNNVLLDELEELEDLWCNSELISFNLYERAKANGTSKKLLLSEIIEWVTPRYEEMKALKAGDTDLKEGYSHMKAKEVNYRIKLLSEMLSDIEKLTTQPKKVRKVRKKKEVPASKMVKNVKFLAESMEYKTTSVDPEKIIGAKSVILFNTKYRMLQVFHCPIESGLKIKGTTLQDFSEETSYQLKLRHAETMLDLINSTSSVNKIGKAIADLTTKKSNPNGRINKDTLILKVFK